MESTTQILTENNERSQDGFDLNKLFDHTQPVDRLNNCVLNLRTKKIQSEKEILVNNKK